MGLLTGITKNINEVLDSYLSGIPTFGAPGQQFNPLPTPSPHEINELYPNWNYYPGGVGEGGLDGTSYAHTIFGVELPRMSTGYGKTMNKGGLDEAALARDELTNPAAQELWGGVIKENTARVNTVLEERSYLDFYFPNSNIGRRRVVFFENPKITEERQPKYASKQIVGRNEPVRLFVGANSRKVKVSFTYTLPHVEAFFAMMGYMPNGFNDTASSPGSSADYAAAQIMQGVGNTPRRTSLMAWRKFTAHTVSKFFGLDFKTSTDGASVSMTNTGLGGPRFYQENRNTMNGVNGMEVIKQGSDTFIERLVNSWSVEAQPLSNSDMVATYYTQFVIDTLRASVIGDTLNDGNMAVGPPIVRFRHGTVFNEAPFIVTNMNVDYTSEAGYEVRTLLPRQVKFTLNLEEFRQTHGSHHGGITEQVSEASNVIELSFKDGSINGDRAAGKRWVF